MKKPLIWIVPLALVLTALSIYQNAGRTEPPPVIPLKLESVRVTAETKSMVSVKGYIENIGTEPLMNVIVLISIYDRRDDLIRTLRTSPDFNTLRPQMTSPFSAMITDVDGFYRYEISFQTLDGEVIPHL